MIATHPLLILKDLPTNGFFLATSSSYVLELSKNYNSVAWKEEAPFVIPGHVDNRRVPPDATYLIEPDVGKGPVEMNGSFRPGGEDAANPDSMLRYLHEGSRRRIARVRDLDPFQGILLVRAYDDCVSNLRGIFRTSREHEEIDNASFDRETLLSASRESNETIEDRLLVNVRSVLTDQKDLESIYANEGRLTQQEGRRQMNERVSAHTVIAQMKSLID